ncbi:MAG: hypothetical protein AAB544_00260 [Patescibacteria group bacterium]
MPILATILVAAAMAATDHSAECLAELKLDRVPTKNPTHLYLYRRCLNTRGAEVKRDQGVDRRLQRLDQYFWRDKETGEKRKSASEDQLKNDIRSNLSKRKGQQEAAKSRAEIMKEARTKARTKLRLLERARDDE